MSKAKSKQNGGRGKAATGKKGATAKGKPATKAGGKAGGKWPSDPRNPFLRPTSAYHVAFNILAAHPDGMTRERLVELLAKATGKDLKHAGFDAQVLLSARGAAGDGLNPFEGPRHRSCRAGFWVRRGDGGRVQLVVD
jgi:hypothetical protein